MAVYVIQWGGMARTLLIRGNMTSTEDEIDQELEQTHARLLLDLVGAGNWQGVYILTPPPADEPE